MRLRVRGGVRALVPMLSADTPRDNRCARVRATTRDIIIAEPSVFSRRVLGTRVKSAISSEERAMRPRSVGDTFNFSEGGGLRDDDN